MSQDQQPCVVGVSPWLPWPLGGWPWWTEPVPGQRLAMLRIGLGLCMLLDICLGIAPFTLDYFGKGELGDPAVFAWRFSTPRSYWSLLRGFDEDVMIYLSLATFFLTTLWLFGNSLARLLLIRHNPPVQDRSGVALALWVGSLTWYVCGLWARMFKAGQPDDLAWIVPLIGAGLCLVLLALEVLLNGRDATERVPWLALGLAFFFLVALTVFGRRFVLMKDYDQTAWWMPFFRSWQENDALLMTAMGLWIASIALMLLGCCTRLAVVLTWMLSVSFDSINSYLGNAGDTIRIILLLYLMLSPCGAAWSVDAWWKKRPGPVFVHPWPIRLLFVQMILIYFMNGLYKACGTAWLDGSSLHFVLGDVALARFSQAWLPLAPIVIRLLTWSVLAWELTFPVLVLWNWPRRFALFFGVMFHLGIWATMELGPFAPYALCMYLPLLPWERLRRRSSRAA